MPLEGVEKLVEFMKKFDTKKIEYYENIFDNLNEEDRKLLKKIREKLAMKKIENPESENGSKNEGEDEFQKQKSPLPKAEYAENLERPVKPRKSEELKIDFQISKEPKQKDENIQVKKSQETVKKEIINFEDKEQETEEKIENQTEEEMDESEDSENNRKKVRYEDGTWKFF